MRKALTTILAVVLFAAALPGLTGCFWKRVPKKWYNKTLDYYREGLSSNWANEDPSNGFYIGSDLKVLDASREFGYLITDLDGDGNDELLIGFNDGSSTTKFTDVYVWQRGYGAYQSFTGNDGYYTYLCGSGIIAHDSWYGSQTQREFLKWNPETGFFNVIEGEGKYLPMKWELTAF